MATRLVFGVLVLLFVAGIFLAACPREPVATVTEDAGPAPAPVVVTKAEPPEWPHAFVERVEVAPERYCAIGAKRECTPGGIQLPTVDGRRGGPYMHCMQYADGSFRFDRSTCNTPLVVAFDDRPVVFTTSDAPFHVGISERTEWVSSTTPWLALDRDGSGCIEGERELFAGFAPLAELDDNHDSIIDASDRAFGSLVLWADRDQDKRCDPSELTPLTAAGITALELAHRTPEAVAAGSHEGEISLVHLRFGAKARLVDVYLAPATGAH